MHPKTILHTGQGILLILRKAAAWGVVCLNIFQGRSPRELFEPSFGVFVALLNVTISRQRIGHRISPSQPTECSGQNVPLLGIVSLKIPCMSRHSTVISEKTHSLASSTTPNPSKRGSEVPREIGLGRCAPCGKWAAIHTFLARSLAGARNPLLKDFGWLF